MMEQLAYFPYSQRIKEKYILEAKAVLENAIFSNELCISEIPAVIQDDLEVQRNDDIKSILKRQNNVSYKQYLR